MVKVSFIMSVYNPYELSHLTESLNSIFSQTFQDFELVLCDDGSSFDVEDFIRNNFKDTQIKKIKFIKNDVNKGLAYSLNRCINESSGEFIARMDADDLIPADRLEIQIKVLEENMSIGFVSSQAIVFDDDGPFGVRSNPENPKLQDLIQFSPYIHAATIFRKSILEEVNGYTVADYTTRTEDYDLWFRLCHKGIYGTNIQIPLYKIREDKEAYKRKKYKYRIDESITRFKGYRLNEVRLIDYIFVLKPLIVGLIPTPIIRILKEHRDEKNK